MLAGRIPRSPIYLNRNLRIKNPFKVKDEPHEDDVDNEKGSPEVQDKADKPAQNGQEAASASGETANRNLLEELEKKLNERNPLERTASQSDRVDYDVSDETECKFNSDSKMLFTVTKDSYLYKHSAFTKARQVSQSICLIK